jgi:hypothetical protein
MARSRTGLIEQLREFNKKIAFRRIYLVFMPDPVELTNLPEISGLHSISRLHNEGTPG